MFSHVMVGSGDLERSKSFYNKVLGTLGFEGEPIHSIAPSGHSRLFYRHNGGTSCEDPPGLRDGALGPIHLAYVRDPDGNKLCALHRPKA
jgi:catechol 2,3-dioxygenase-like lactoylglutathione lyase family enzyme